MAKSPKALVTGSVLIWARETHGNIPRWVVAKKVGVEESVLASWEAGTEFPTVAQLRKLANFYKRPLAVFWFPEPPEPVQGPQDFRLLPDGDAEYMDPPLRLALREARDRQQVAAELAGELQIEVEGWTLHRNGEENSSSLAGRLREHLGVDLDDQLNTRRDGYGSLKLWRSAVESRGVLVFQASGVSVVQMRGFCLPHSKFPVIGLNSNDAPTARLFSLLHELAHLTLGHSGLCTLDDTNVEVFCNAVAGRALVPTSALLAQDEVPENSPDSWLEEDLKSLASRFGVSREVVLRRLLDEGKASAEEYQRYRRLWAVAVARSSPGGGNYYRNQIARFGRPFIRLVLEAADATRIPLNRASSYLDMRVTGFEKLRAQL